MTFTPHLALIAYASELRAPLPRPQLDRLLSEWRVANARRGITGFMLQHGDAVVQAIEGFPEDVIVLYEAIERDPRHRNIVQLAHRPITKRWYGDWSMGLARATPADLAAIPGLAGFDTAAARYWELDDLRAEALLEAFRDGYWRRTIG